MDPDGAVFRFEEVDVTCSVVKPFHVLAKKDHDLESCLFGALARPLRCLAPVKEGQIHLTLQTWCGTRLNDCKACGGIQIPTALG